MRKLTVELSRCSKSSIMDGADRNLADSGELLQRGTVKIRRLRPPSHDYSLREILCVEAELQGLTLRLPMTCSDGEELDRS
jgi:hypothetical protein